MQNASKIRHPARFIVSILVTLGAGLVGSLFTIPAIPTWYAGLIKPWFTPPSWVFGPVWTALYIIMGVSFCLAWEATNKKKDHKEILVLYSTQLFLNILWSIIFFGFHNMGTAVIEIVFLWYAIFFTMKKFHMVDHISALLFVPYIFWVSFVTLLTFAIWQLNI